MTIKIQRLLTILIFPLSFFLFFLSCENTPSQPKADIEYNIDNVRILLPRAFQKISSKQEVVAKFFPNQPIENLSPLNQILLNELIQFNGNQQHWFVKYENEQLEFIALKTDGPPLRPSPDVTSRILETYEDKLYREYLTPDSTYRHVLIEDKIKGAHMVQYFKFKYFHSNEGNDWFTTNYLIYSNSRTIGLAIYSQKKEYNDLENHMQFIRIDKK